MIRIKLYYIICLLTLPLLAHSQIWTGPDVELCGSTEGVMIGIENAPSEYCYQWSPTTGIQGSPSDARILVKPEETTTYTLVVTGANFTFRQEENVKVTVDFGSVEFNPSFTKPNGESNQSTAIVTNNPGNHPFTWSIVETGMAALGCTINSTSGEISGCTSAGEITVRATRTDFPVCKTQATFRVNQGVKDIIATDLSMDNGLRVAKTGETLVLVSRNGVKFEAIPNDNETFGPDDITWTGPSAPSGGVTMWTSDQGTPLSFDVAANDKSVHVIRKPANEEALTINGNNFIGMLEAIIAKFKPNRKVSGLDEVGSCLPPFKKDKFEFSINLKEEAVNKFNSPEEGIKQTIEGQVSGGIEGKVCFPPPYSSAPNPFGYYYTYAFLAGALKVAVSGSVDEGASTNPEWIFNGLEGISVEGELKAGLGADFGATLPGEFLTVNGQIRGSAAITLATQWRSPHIEYKFKIEPLIVEGNLSVWFTNPNNPIIGPISKKYNIIDAYDPPFAPLFTLDY